MSAWSLLGAEQVARVCETLEQSGDVDRLARFLWSLPADPHLQAELARQESVVRARSLVAQHNVNDLFHLLDAFRLEQVHVYRRTARRKVCEAPTHSPVSIIGTARIA